MAIARHEKVRRNKQPNKDIDGQNLWDEKQISGQSETLPAQLLEARFSFHVIGFSDPVDLWVIKIKKPMILCARSTSRSSE